MKIRAAKPEEMATIADLQTTSWQQSYRGVLSDDLLDRRLRGLLHAHWTEMRLAGDDFILVADDNGIQGFIAVWIKDRPYIDNLHVRRGTQGRGIGRQLMRAAAQRMIDLSHSSTYLGVAAQNAPAIAFYRRLGGQFGETTTEILLGDPMEVIWVEWHDLAAL